MWWTVHDGLVFVFASNFCCHNGSAISHLPILTKGKGCCPPFKTFQFLRPVEAPTEEREVMAHKNRKMRQLGAVPSTTRRPTSCEHYQYISFSKPADTAVTINVFTSLAVHPYILIDDGDSSKSPNFWLRCVRLPKT